MSCDFPRIQRFYGDARMIHDAATGADRSVRFAFACVLVLLAIGACIGLVQLWNFLMTKLPTLAVLGLCALALAGCGTIGALTSGDTAGKQILSNLQGCTRHYEGAIGAGVNGSFRIDCLARAEATVEP